MDKGVHVMPVVSREKHNKNNDKKFIREAKELASSYAESVKDAETHEEVMKAYNALKIDMEKLHHSYLLNIR